MPPKTFLEKVITAIRTLKDHSGSSRQAIAKFLKTEYGSDNVVALRQALKKGVQSNALEQIGKQRYAIPGETYEDPAAAAEHQDVDADASAEVQSIPDSAPDLCFWIQCVKCSKWRKTSPECKESEIPDDFTCDMNVWDSKYSTCEAEEEPQPDDEAEVEAERALTFEEMMNAFEEKQAQKEAKKEEAWFAMELRNYRKEQEKADEWIKSLSPAELKDAKILASSKDASGQLPLHKYAYTQNDSTAAMLSRRDLAICPEIVNEADCLGKTALHYAAHKKYFSLNKALLQNGADPYILDIMDRAPIIYNNFPKHRPKPMPSWEKELHESREINMCSGGWETYNRHGLPNGCLDPWYKSESNLSPPQLAILEKCGENVRKATFKCKDKYDDDLERLANVDDTEVRRIMEFRKHRLAEQGASTETPPGSGTDSEHAIDLL